MNKRKNIEIDCKICGLKTKVNGISFHLTAKHGITKDEYIEKYGEYRQKYISYNTRSDENEFICKIDGVKLASERHLTYYIRKTHNISKEEYIIKYVLNGNIPKCKCGCGNFVSIHKKGTTYYSEYISGHNSHMHIGKTRSDESKKKMRVAAIERMKRGDAVFYRGVSNDEVDLGNFLKSIYNGNIIHNDTDLLSGLELDFYLPELKLAIELNGDRFHSDLYKKKNYHLNKTKECNHNGVRLIHIWLSDWNSKNDIIKSQLNNFIGNVKNKIFARNCVIKDVSYEDSKIFLNKNHLQQNSVSKYRYGLYYNNELVQIMTFSSLRKATGRIHKDGEFELVRLCNKINTVVVGGASKLFKHFINKNSPNKIISFANRDWSSGNVYDVLNMNLIGETKPGYFYSNGKTKGHRYKYQKHRLVKMGFDVNKSEYQIMTERGYYRVWNTGNFIYEISL